MLKSSPATNSTSLHLSLLFLLIALSIVVRFWALGEVSESVYGSSLLPDERYYHDWAVAILNGKPPEKAFEYAPLPAYLMALTYKVLSVDINHIRTANVCINTLGCLVIYFITLLLVNRRWALAALGMAACCRELVFYSVVPLKTSLSFFLFALLTYLILLSIRHYSRLLLLATGFLLGLAMTVRPNVLILLPLLPLAIIFLNSSPLDKKKRLLIPLLTGIGFAGALLPLALHNYHYSKQVSLIPVQSGFLLYCTNTVDNPTPLYRPVQFASSLPEEQGIHFTIEASRRTQSTMDTRQASNYWRLQVVNEAIAHPLQYLKKFRDKTLMLFSASENGDHYHIGFMSSFISFLNILQLRYWHFLVVGYTAMIVGWKKSKEIQCLATIALAYLITMLLYSTGNRFTLPLLALLIPATAWMGHHCFNLITTRQYRRVIAAVLIATLIVFLGRIPVRGAGDLSMHFNNLAFLHNQRGDTETASRYWLQSANLKQTYSDVAVLFLAGHIYRQSGYRRAIEALFSISDKSFMAAAKYGTLGDIYLHHGQRLKALDAYRKSLGLNSGQIRIRHALITILDDTEPQKSQEEKKALHTTLKYYH